MIKVSFSIRELQIIYEDYVREFWLSEYSKENIVKMDETKHLYIAKLNGKIVGSGAVGVDNNMAYLSGVFVDPAFKVRE